MRQVECPNPKCVRGYVGFKKVPVFAGRVRLELQNCPICFGFGHVNEDQYDLHKNEKKEKNA